MRKFKCNECGHTWQVIFGDATPGCQYACPLCKSLKVQRTDKGNGVVQKGAEKAPPDGENPIPSNNPEVRKPAEKKCKA